MKLIDHVQNLLLCVLLSLITSYPSYSQTQKPSLVVHYELDSVLKEAMIRGQEEEIDVYVSTAGKLFDSAMKHLKIPLSTKRFELDLLDGTYDITFSITIPVNIKKIEYFTFQEIYDSTFSQIVVSNKSPKTLKILLKNNCPFRRDLNNNVCPKCNSSDKVIPICKGLALKDYECHFNTEHSHCSPPACSPTWYCKTDKLEF